MARFRRVNRETSGEEAWPFELAGEQQREIAMLCGMVRLKFNFAVIINIINNYII